MGTVAYRSGKELVLPILPSATQAHAPDADNAFVRPVCRTTHTCNYSHCSHDCIVTFNGIASSLGPHTCSAAHSQLDILPTAECDMDANPWTAP